MKNFRIEEIISEKLSKDGQDNIYLGNGKELRRDIGINYPFGTFTVAQDEVVHEVINFLMREDMFNVGKDFNKELKTKEWKYDITIRDRVIDQKNPYKATLAIREKVLSTGIIPQFEEVMRQVSSYDSILDKLSEKYYKKLRLKKTKKTVKEILKVIFKDIFWVGDNEELECRIEETRKKDRIAAAAISEWNEEEKREYVNICLEKERLKNEERKKLLEFKQANLKGVGQAGARQVDFDVNSLRNCTVYAIEKNREIIYVGCTWREVQERWNEHIENTKNGDKRVLYKEMREGEIIFRILWQGEANRLQLEAMEYGFISFFKPKCNLEGVCRQYKFSTNKGSMWKGKMVKSWRLKSVLSEETIKMLEELK